MRSFHQIIVRASSSLRARRRRSLPSPPLSSAAHSRSFSQLPSPSLRSEFGIAFDIDGVILRGSSPIGGSVAALRRLYDESFGNLKVPYVFLTNASLEIDIGGGQIPNLNFYKLGRYPLETSLETGAGCAHETFPDSVLRKLLALGGGVPESKRASELSKLLGVKILSSQVIQGHTPFKQLLKSFENELIVAVGKGEPATVMSEYGFKNALSIDEYAACFDSIDPLASYKKWTTEQNAYTSSISKGGACLQRVQAAFVVSDSVDWSRDIQVLCDILRTGGLPGREIAHQPPLFFANDDLEYQAVFPSERLGMGAFRIALESIFNSLRLSEFNPDKPLLRLMGDGFVRWKQSLWKQEQGCVHHTISDLAIIHPNPLKYASFGKPNPSVYKNAERVLKEVLSSRHDHQTDNHIIGENHVFKSLYMIGDNPSVDIKGARQAGQPWFSILTRTGVFKGKGNHTEHPADLVVDTVEEAVNYILTKEAIGS